MKQIIFVAGFVFAFCFAAFAQSNENKTNQTKPKFELIAEFNDENEWNKLTIALISMKLSENSSVIGLIGIKNDKNFRLRLNLLKKAMAFQKADLTRIRLLIANEQKAAINVLVSQNCAEPPECENCIAIRAEDIDKIEKLFKPKTTKNRKRK